MDNEFYKQCSSRAIRSYRKGDEQRWVSALWCSKVVGSRQRGLTLGLASDMSVSPDTVENLAHAYEMYSDLCKLSGARKFVRSSRKLPFVYYSHFRALHKAREDYNLTDSQCLSLLMDIVQNEGGISSRDIDDHTAKRFGNQKDWRFYAAKAQKAIANALQQPDLPDDVRKAMSGAFNVIGERD